MTAISETRTIFKQAIKPAQEQLVERDVRWGEVDRWHTEGRSFSSYLEDWYYIVDKNSLMKDLSSLEAPVVVDLMSQTEALATLFYSLPQANKLGIAVARADKRDSYEIYRDNALSILQVSGDICISSTWGEIRRKLKGRKANLVVEGAMAGIRYIPEDKRVWGTLLQRAWGLLDENGGMLIAEIPTSLVLAEADVDIPRWSRVLEEAGIDHSCPPDNANNFLRLVKTPDSPKQIPLLP